MTEGAGIVKSAVSVPVSCVLLQVAEESAGELVGVWSCTVPVKPLPLFKLI